MDKHDLDSDSGQVLAYLDYIRQKRYEMFKALPIKEQERIRRKQARINKTKVGPRVKCLKCKEVLQSKHRHDFVQCSCGNLFVDGGSDYLRMGAADGTYKVYKQRKLKPVEWTQAERKALGIDGRPL